MLTPSTASLHLLQTRLMDLFLPSRSYYFPQFPEEEPQTRVL